MSGARTSSGEGHRFVTPATQFHATNAEEVDLRAEVIDLVRRRGYERREVPFKLASGKYSHDYIDGKFALDGGPQLVLVSKMVILTAEYRGMEYDAVGGLTMGADALAHGVAIVAGCKWFSVRKEPKPRGREQWIEGARLVTGERVLLVDDVVTTGTSMLLAHKRATEAGARVGGVITMVDRGERAAKIFADLGVPYASLVSYQDLGIDPIGS